MSGLAVTLLGQRLASISLIWVVRHQSISRFYFTAHSRGTGGVPSPRRCESSSPAQQSCLIFRTLQSHHHTITIHTNSLGVASSLWSESINSAIKLHHQTAIPDPTVAAQTRRWLLSLSSDTNRRLCDVRQREELLRNSHCMASVCLAEGGNSPGAASP